MNFKKYLLQLVVYLLWIFIVILIFKFIQPKQLAAVIAGVGFVFIPSIVLFYELKNQPRYKFYIFTLFVFIFLDALPIFITRLINWGVEFEKLTIFGFPAQSFHSISNILYTALILLCIYALNNSRKQN